MFVPIYPFSPSVKDLERERTRVDRVVRFCTCPWLLSIEEEFGEVELEYGREQGTKP